MPANSAEYMREYRKKRKARQPDDSALRKEIEALRDEVAHLKRQLADRAPVIPKAVGEGIGRGLSQAERDAVLRKLTTAHK